MLVAVPLLKSTSKTIAREPVFQSTPFTFKLIVDLCWLLQDKHLWASVYHLQTNALFEMFNQTLNQMLRRVVADDDRNWELSPL